MMKKRILALLLTVCMLLSLMPLGAFAEEDSEDTPVLAEEANEDEGGHEHTFGNWTPDGDQHRGTCTQEGCTETKTFRNRREPADLLPAVKAQYRRIWEEPTP